jgi:hypothetical protein
MTENSERAMLEGLGYKVNDRQFGNVWKYIEKSGLFKRDDFLSQDLDTVYSGAEHRGKPKLPNLTVLPNLALKTGSYLLGQTFGHQHMQYLDGDTRKFQEIYEFLGYGAMLIRNSEGTTLYLLKPGEKVIAGTGDNMTMFNLDYTPLITLDYANPDMNKANKDLEDKIGSLMIIERWQASEAATIFKINERYVDQKLLCCAPEVADKGYKFWGGVKVPSEESKFMISVGDTGLGKELYEALKPKQITEQERQVLEKLSKRGLGIEAAFYLKRFTPYAEEFKNPGINLVFGGNLPPELKQEFSKPLLELILNKNKVLLDSLGMI